MVAPSLAWPSWYNEQGDGDWSLQKVMGDKARHETVISLGTTYGNHVGASLEEEVRH